MEDKEIIALFWGHDEEALRQTEKKYARYCYAVAFNLLGNREDAEECVNDAYAAAWNGIPPENPAILSSYLAKITRNRALKRLETQNTDKRGGGKTTEVFEELEDFLQGENGEEIVDKLALREALRRFLAHQKPEKRTIFLKRYWYMMTVPEIAAEMNTGESRIKMLLLRQREELRKELNKEGIIV